MKLQCYKTSKIELRETVAKIKAFSEEEYKISIILIFLQLRIKHDFCFVEGKGDNYLPDHRVQVENKDLLGQEEAKGEGD